MICSLKNKTTTSSIRTSLFSKILTNFNLDFLNDLYYNIVYEVQPLLVRLQLSPHYLFLILFSGIAGHTISLIVPDLSKIKNNVGVMVMKLGLLIVSLIGAGAVNPRGRDCNTVPIKKQ